MYHCIKCQSNNLQRRGTFHNKTDNVDKQRYQCNECKTQFSVELPRIENNNKIISHKENKKYVITSYQGGEYNLGLLNVLENYCDYNDAELIILHSPNKSDDEERVSELERYIVSDNFDIQNYITVYANLSIGKTIENPLTGLNTLSKNGKSLIVGHSVLQMKMLSQFGSGHPIMMHSTGSISIPDYKLTTKPGLKADHNHSYSALILELDNTLNLFHIRVLNAEDNGNLYDIDKYYTPNAVIENQSCDVLVFGDTHVSELDELVYKATYTNPDSIMNIMKPKVIVHHDIYSHNQLQSHHNVKSFISRYKHYVNGHDNIEDELNLTLNFLEKTVPSWVEQCVIINSNHDRHLQIWLENQDKNHDYSNALLYHKLMVRVLTAIHNGLEINPLKFYFEDNCSEYLKSKLRFLNNNESYMIHNIELGLHGDRGASGAKGGVSTFASMPVKNISGHTHQPNITKSAYAVGTSSRLDLDYVQGLSSWNNTHCIVHKSGKRQLISIIKGKWKL